MNRGLWIARKNHLLCLIRKVSELEGGDDPEWFKQHCLEVVESHPEEQIEVAISYYAGMIQQLINYPKTKP
jgi:hypothetical protein